MFHPHEGSRLVGNICYRPVPPITDEKHTLYTHDSRSRRGACVSEAAHTDPASESYPRGSGRRIGGIADALRRRDTSTALHSRRR